MRMHVARYIAVLLSVAVFGTAQASWLPTIGFDFRNNHWGNSRAEVKLAETGPILREDDMLLIYQAKVEGVEGLVIYMFVRDELTAAFYQLSDHREDNNLYFTDLDNIKVRLEEELGNPQVENWNWADDPFERSRDLWGNSLAFGLVEVDVGWITDRSIVSCRISGGNFSGDVMVMYADSELFNDSRLVFEEHFAQNVGDYTPFFRTFLAD